MLTEQDPEMVHEHRFMRTMVRRMESSLKDIKIIMKDISEDESEIFGTCAVVALTFLFGIDNFPPSDERNLENPELLFNRLDELAELQGLTLKIPGSSSDFLYELESDDFRGALIITDADGKGTSHMFAVKPTYKEESGNFQRVYVVIDFGKAGNLGYRSLDEMADIYTQADTFNTKETGFTARRVLVLSATPDDS